MLSDKELEELIQPIVNIYNKIELELIIDIAQRFSNYSSIDGSLEWYLRKLDEMNALNDNAIKIFARYSNIGEAKIWDMLSTIQFANFIAEDIDRAYEEGLSDRKSVV